MDQPGTRQRLAVLEDADLIIGVDGRKALAEVDKSGRPGGTSIGTTRKRAFKTSSRGEENPPWSTFDSWYSCVRPFIAATYSV